MELCGGTHVEDLSKIYPFKILSEGSVAAGTYWGMICSKMSANVTGYNSDKISDVIDALCIDD